MSSDTKQISGYLGVEEREERKGEVIKGGEGNLWGTYVKTHQTLCSLGNVN